jgi:FemAB-related protein (PEP-CTERM system-associated)
MAADEATARLWQQFVDDHVEASRYHRWGWKQVIERSFGWPTFYLMAEENDRVRGILPLAWQKSWVFGSFLTSLPFLNGGGIVAEDPQAEQSLLHEAINLARRLGVRYLELRHRGDHGLNLPSKTTKVAPVLPVEPNSEKMWQSLHHKVRTDIRKAMKSELVATFGGRELLSEFYAAFAENMRDLGTPVYSRSFFSEVLRAFPDETHICLLRHGPTPVATSFLIGFRDTVEAGWSASRYGYLRMRPNMLLYWQLLCFAGERHYRYFDFGRSTVGSGTHRFKQQWGTTDVPLHWDYWLRDGGDLPELNPENPRYRLAIWVWRKLPVAVTKLIGPRIVRCLP